MLINTVLRSARKFFVGRDFKFQFLSCDEPKIPEIDGINLYIHVPFCQNLCPYCPYNKIEHDEALMKDYFEALRAELKLYYQQTGKIEISSIYIGGGSPVLAIKELKKFLGEIRTVFDIAGDICIELNPNDCSRENVRLVKECGVDLVSLGIQSFNQKHLDFIGRKYDISVIEEAIKNIKAENFKSFNADLMFALPGQTAEDLKSDIEKVMSYGIDQVTNYPLFTFPYSSIGEHLKINDVKMPPLRERRKQYNLLYDLYEKNGYKRASVWSFKKGGESRYSSVTRDNYIGLGAGAGTHFDSGYYLNTFSISEYISRCRQKKFPTALHFEFTQKANDYFWLYWRFYDTSFDLTEFKKRFGDRKRAVALMKIISWLRMGKFENNEMILTKRGSFWLHLVQNYYSLSYVNTIWSKAMKKPFPAKIEF